MKSEDGNGVLECGSDGWKRNGVKEYWSSVLANRLCGPAGGRRSVEGSERAQVGKGGFEMQANPGLSGRVRENGRLFPSFPDDSTQVVDFPHLRVWRVSSEG